MKKPLADRCTQRGHFSQPGNAFRWVGATLLASAVAVLMPVTTALAIPINSNVVVNATVNLNGSSVPATGGANQSGTYKLKNAGIDSTATVDSGLVITGSLPLGANLTDLGDGVGLNASMNGTFNGGDATTDGFFSDYTFDLTNNSATETFKITLGVSFDNMTSAGGPATPPFGAFNHNLISLKNVTAGGTEFFFTDLTTDTVFGDANSGGPTGTFGVTQSETGNPFFDFILAPGAHIALSGREDLRGGAFETGAHYAGHVNAFISVDAIADITPPPNGVPEPGALMLASAALFALGLSRRRRTSYSEPTHLSHQRFA